MQTLLKSENQFKILQKCGYLLVITMLLAGQPLWAADENAHAAPLQQQITVTGVVTDNQGETLPGVNIVIKGTSMGQASNADGEFSLAVPGNNAVLVFSYLGYITQEVTVVSNRRLTIILIDDTQMIDEIVVVGYGTQKKTTMTGSVSTINNKELTVTKNENVVNALAGKMPGLRISQKNAQPGAYNTKIDVRGFGEPLFVIDGIPRDKDYFARMDPEEIESITILKDASAAIYGMRAANGVMLITTKSGTSQGGKVDISYSGNYAWQQIVNIPKGITPTDWMTLRNEQRWQDFGNNYLNRQDARHSQEEFNQWAGHPGYDWIGATFEDFFPQMQHNMSINGGSDNLRYFVSLGYFKQEGAYKSGSLYDDRWNFRSNVDAKITKRLSARISLGAILNEVNEPNAGLWSVFKSAWLHRPDASFYANDNPNYLNGDDQYISDGENSLAQTDSKYMGYRIIKQRRLNGALTLTYEIPGVKGLTARATYDYGMRISDNTAYKHSFNLYKYNATAKTYDPIVRNSPSDITRQAWFNKDTDMQLGLSYANIFGSHTVNGTFVFEEQFQEWDDFRAYRELKVNSEYLFAGEDDKQQGTGGIPGDRLNKALIGRASYDYAGKYMAEFLFRYEGSSRWPKDSRWGFFPSFSVGWRISEENFIKGNLDFISNLKLRASYGQLGDDNLDMQFNYPPISVGYNLDSENRGWYYDGILQGGVRPTSIPNPNLTWYKVVMKNIALDFGVLNNKVMGTFELFQRDRSGLLATSSAVIPGTVGAALPQENLNDDRNYGWELELHHRNRISDFEYAVSGQISATRSKRTYWLEEPASHSYDHWRNRTSGRNNDIWWGREAGGMFNSINDIRTFQTYPMGQNSLPGDWWFVDWNEDGIVDGSDDHPVATKGLPFFNYGLALTAGYKNFDMTMQFQGTYKVYVALAELFTEALPFGGKNTLEWFMDRWRPENSNADYFAPDTKWISGWYPVTGHDGRRTGTNNMMDASYFRLKTMEIGYTIPGSILNKLLVKNLRIYVSAYNLLTFTKLKNTDPERPGSEPGVGASDNNYVDMYSYPNNKSYILGATIKF